MTAVTAATPVRKKDTTETGLRALSRPSTATPPRLRYVVATLVGLFAILIGQLSLSIALGNGAYEIRDLERQLAERSRDLSIVSEEIGQMQDPQTLAQLAVTLGMVDDGDPAYLRLSDAQVIGSMEPASSGGTSLVTVVPGEPSAIALTAAQAVAAQPSAQGESLPAFAAVSEDTGEVIAPGDTLLGVEPLVPESPSTTAATPSFGGDLPAPVTR